MATTDSVIEVPSRWGRPARWRRRRHAAGASRLAVVLPGQAYPLQAPVMWYAARAAFEAGCDVLGVQYGYEANGAALGSGEFAALAAEVGAGLAEHADAGAYADVVVIAKSLGTAVAAHVGEGWAGRPLGAAYLTPLERTIPAIRACPRMLVVVGDRDGLFGPGAVAQITGLPQVRLEVVPGADHRLELAGDWAGSLAVLRRVAELCAGFCGEAARPPAGPPEPSGSAPGV